MQGFGKILAGLLFGIVAVTGLITCLILWLAGSSHRRIEETSIAEEGYPQEIKSYLEDKYNGRFQVNPQYKYISASSPFPRSPGTYEYEAYDEDGYALRIKLRPVSGSDPAIGQLSDNYIWKSLSLQLEDWFEEELSDILPENYKLYCLMNGIYMTRYETAPSASLEEYLGSGHWDRAQVIVITPPGAGKEDFTEETIYPVLEKFHAVSGRQITVVFRYYCLESDEMYESIDIKQLQNGYFAFKEEKNPLEAISQFQVMQIELEDE